jgi:hypothetical protein
MLRGKPEHFPVDQGGAAFADGQASGQQLLNFYQVRVGRGKRFGGHVVCAPCTFSIASSWKIPFQILRSFA